MWTAHSFALGVQISAPFLVFGLVINLAMGLIARLQPAIQVFFIAQPAQIAIGMAALALTTTAADSPGQRFAVGPDRGHIGPHRGQTDFVARGQSLVRFRTFAVHPNLAFAQNAVNGRLRHTLQFADEPVVEALAIGPRVDSGLGHATAPGGNGGRTVGGVTGHQDFL
jgi:hypothetical protein